MCSKHIPGMCPVILKLVIPAQTCDVLSCGQGIVYGRTDRQTDRRIDRRTDGETQATTIPLRPESSRGKNGRSLDPVVTTSRPHMTDVLTC